MIQQIHTIPRHVVILMDGNRRWAKRRGLPAVMGHRKVVEERLEPLIEAAGKMGIQYLTFWAFSTENWGRAAEEVSGIMNLARLALERYAQRMIAKGARIRVIGDLERFPKDIQAGLSQMMEVSKDNTAITVTFALNYGGRDEITRAVRKISDAIETGKISSEEINESLISNYLDTAGMPDPDFIIRTSGEQRLSGFMPWQGVYSELYFPEILMPDFDVAAFEQAIEEYGRRQRRFGAG